MTAATDLQALTRAVGDLCNLAIVAEQLVSEAEAGDTGRVHVLGALLRALRVQARATHSQAEAQWVAAVRAERPRAPQEGGAA